MSEFEAMVAKLERITTGILPGVWLSSDEAEQTVTFHLAARAVPEDALGFEAPADAQAPQPTTMDMSRDPGPLRLGPKW